MPTNDRDLGCLKRGQWRALRWKARIEAKNGMRCEKRASRAGRNKRRHEIGKPVAVGGQFRQSQRIAQSIENPFRHLRPIKRQAIGRPLEATSDYRRCPQWRDRRPLFPMLFQYPLLANPEGVTFALT